METVNDTTFSFAFIPGRMDYPDHSLTLIVKGTFSLSPGTAIEQAPDQDSLTGDRFYPDDDDMRGGLRYESDFAYFKPHADLLLVGTCYPPGEKPVSKCNITFRVGSRSRTLNVFGNRQWEKHWLKWKATDPESFTKMQIRYENSFGGEKSKKNPVGKGSNPIKDAQGNEIRPLPNIEDPLQPIDSPKSSTEPAGFGPMGRMWQTRYSITGTYTGNYRESRWPWRVRTSISHC